MFRKSEETPRTEIQSAQKLCPHTFFLNLFNYAYPLRLAWFDRRIYLQCTTLLQRVN